MSGTVILDSEGLSLLLRDNRIMVARLVAARKRDDRVVVSAMTIVEAYHQRVRPDRLAWVLSRLSVEPVTKEIAHKATGLLRDAGNLHGHKYAIDAVVAATALQSHRPVTVLTSDPDDLTRLCGRSVAIVKV